MNIIEELNGIISKSSHTYKTIQLIPDGGESLFIVNLEEDTNVGLSKKTYFALFKQCHTYWHGIQQKDHKSVVRNADGIKLQELFLMTTGYLITTNENHSILTLHEQIVYKLSKNDPSFIAKEIDLISTFLQSRLKRINKSSSLWLLMKKLTIINENNEILYLIIDRAIRSCETHFANYYACNYLRWLSNVLKFQNKTPQLKYLQKQVTRLCKSNLTDVSLWRLLQDLASPGVSSYSIEEYNHLVGIVNESLENQFRLQNVTNMSDLNPSNTSDLDLDFEEIVKWLLLVECSVETPYRCVVSKKTLVLLQEKLNEQSGGITPGRTLFWDTLKRVGGRV